MSETPSSRLSILTFLLATLVYFVVMKPSLKLADSINVDAYTKYLRTTYTFLIAYLLMVVVSQFLVNASVISTRCGGSFAENMGAAGLFTMLPWSLMFGAVLLLLIWYPGFKTVFGDVAGYFFVARTASALLNQILFDANLQNRIEQDTSLVGEDKKMARSTADMIFKIYNDPSLLINQMSPINFHQVWDMLQPLMRPEARADPAVKEQLFQLVVTKDAVGEACWYLYAGILICLVVALRIQGKSCEQPPSEMEDKYREFLAEQEQKDKERQALAPSDPYLQSTFNPVS